MGSIELRPSAESHLSFAVFGFESSTTGGQGPKRHRAKPAAGCFQKDFALWGKKEQVVLSYIPTLKGDLMTGAVAATVKPRGEKVKDILRTDITKILSKRQDLDSPLLETFCYVRNRNFNCPEH